MVLNRQAVHIIAVDYYNAKEETIGQMYVTELIGESKKGWRSAVQNAITEAFESLDDITGVEITGLKADVVDGNLVNFQAKMKIYSK